MKFTGREKGATRSFPDRGNPTALFPRTPFPPEVAPLPEDQPRKKKGALRALTPKTGDPHRAGRSAAARMPAQGPGKVI
jgi:hypothetical protein